MQRALKGVPEKPIDKPDGVVQVRINEATGLRDDTSATSDWFYAEAVPRMGDTAFVPVPQPGQPGRTAQDVRNQIF
jgi:membrane carboxypeptidase/penicillin-binding protein